MYNEQTIGPYSIVRRLAVGGMAEVFLAEHTTAEGVSRLVVVKRIRTERVENPQLVTMFLDEARLGASVSHPNLVQFLDFGQVSGHYYIVLEYLRGPSLRDVIDTNGSLGLPIDLALPVAVSLCEALHYLHARKDSYGRSLAVVHRDLNPENVIIARTGAVKLIDLGVAKSDDAVYETATGVIKGTFGYMPPEQILSRKDVDHRADIFALGVLLYEMTLGVHPFALETVDQVIDMVRRGQFTAPEVLYSGYPKQLSQLVCRCLEVEPYKRPPNVRSVAKELEYICMDLRIATTISQIAEQIQTLMPDQQSRASKQVFPKKDPLEDEETKEIDVHRLFDAPVEEEPTSQYRNDEDD